MKTAASKTAKTPRTPREAKAGSLVKERTAREGDAPFVAVQSLVRKIPRGKVATYGQLSLLIDRRLTPVDVGWAIRAAKEGSIPWHRVVNGTGGISTDPHHPGLQRDMLESEGVTFDREGKLDLSRFQWRPRAR